MANDDNHNHRPVDDPACDSFCGFNMIKADQLSYASVIDALEKGWAWGWRKKGWIKSDKKPALNPDLWTKLLDLTRQHEMRYHWVKGHAENEYNNRCDALAVAAREKYA